MTEKMQKRLADLIARQQAGEYMRCPRCGRDTMKPDLCTNALSRHVEGVYICDECGTAEALLDFMQQELPLTMWALCRPLRPASGFESMSAEDVLARVMTEQMPALIALFKQCEADSENREEYRSEAYETCPGLTELWTEPFTAKYDTKDSPVMLRFRMTDNGDVQVAAEILEAK